MRRKILKACLALPVLAQLALPRSVHAARGLERVYAQPSPEILRSLPQDHGVHPAFRTEWWYFSGWFESPEFEQAFGVQITFFRSAPNVNVQNPSARSEEHTSELQSRSDLVCRLLLEKKKKKKKKKNKNNNIELKQQQRKYLTEHDKRNTSQK